MFVRPTAQPGATLVERAAGVALVGCVFAVYAQVTGYEFVQLDDNLVVTGNPAMAPGLTLATAWWALTTTYFCWWHPVTWWSHLLDVSLFGFWAGGHHATSVVIHGLNTALVMVALRRWGVRPLVAVAIAALTMLHPTKVESVAWVSERKDVLCGFFFFVTLWAWRAYRTTPSPARYALVLLAYALGLGSKSMLVTLPIVLVVLEHWVSEGAVAWKKLVRELIPLGLLAATFSFITLQTQQRCGFVGTSADVSLWQRVALASYAFVLYLKDVVWPLNLSAHYFRVMPSALPLAAAWAVIAFAVGALWVLRHRARHLVHGSVAFAVMLVPVLGFVPVGSALYADRYLYLSMLPLVTGVVLSLPSRWLEKWAVVVGTTFVVLWLAALSAMQATTWRNTDTLFTSVLEVEPNNHFAQFQLGTLYVAQGRLDLATPFVRDSASSYPWSRAAWARSLLQLGKTEEAVREAGGAYRQSLQRPDPNAGYIRQSYVQAIVARASQLASEGQLAQAREGLLIARRVDPEDGPSLELLEVVERRLVTAAQQLDAGRPP